MGLFDVLMGAFTKYTMNKDIKNDKDLQSQLRQWQRDVDKTKAEADKALAALAAELEKERKRARERGDM